MGAESHLGKVHEAARSAISGCHPQMSPGDMEPGEAAMSMDPSWSSVHLARWEAGPSSCRSFRGLPLAALHIN